MYRRGELSKYNLGKIKPPEIDLPKDTELVWNADVGKWQIFLVRKGTTPSLDELTWQIDVPFKGSAISSGIKYWLQKYDTTEGGAISLERRKKDWLETFKEVRRTEDIRKENQIQEHMYEIGHRCRFLERLAFGAPQCVVPAGPVVGVNKSTGKPIRAYAKSQIGKEVIVGG